MEQKDIQICFCTPEPDFGEVLGRTLGAGFDVKLIPYNDTAATAADYEENYDCVLLDLRELPTGGEVEAGLRHFERFRLRDFSPPIVVMVDDDDAALMR